MAKQTLYTETQVEQIVNFVCGVGETETDQETMRTLASLRDFEHFESMREFVFQKGRR
jgi:hypothetical protein